MTFTNYKIIIPQFLIFEQNFDSFCIVISDLMNLADFAIFYS